MAQETEHRLETLETVLAEFIMQTNRSLNRMERDTADFKEEFKLYLPEYTNNKRIPVFASMSLQPDQLTYLTSLGIYAMALGEENMELLNFDELQGR